MKLHVKCKAVPFWMGTHTTSLLGDRMGNTSSMTSVWSMCQNTTMNLTLVGDSLWCHYQCDRQCKRASVGHVIHFLSEGDEHEYTWSMATVTCVTWDFPFRIPLEDRNGEQIPTLKGRVPKWLTLKSQSLRYKPVASDFISYGQNPSYKPYQRKSQNAPFLSSLQDQVKKEIQPVDRAQGFSSQRKALRQYSHWLDLWECLSMTTL